MNASLCKTDSLSNVIIARDTMDNFTPKPKQTKKPKSSKKVAKETRAKKRVFYVCYVKHQESPVWTEEYQYPQYHSCEPADWQDVYDEKDWQPCKNCNYCGNMYRAEPSGWETLTFEHVNSR